MAESLRYKEKFKPGERRNLWLSRVVLWIVIIIAMIPIMAVFSASVAKGSGFGQASIFPKSFTLDNYKHVIFETNFKMWTKNSMIICFSVSILQLIMTIPAAFAFAKMKFKGRKYGLMSLLILQMFPTVMALPAILGIAYKLELLDKMWALVLIMAVGSAYNIWLMKGYMDGIPTELCEAAHVDGATDLQVMFKIILPLLKNMIVVIFIFSFISAYSEFMFTSALMKAEETQTLATGLRIFIQDAHAANWTYYSAGAVMASIPIVIISVVSQKFISSGLVAGAVKG